MFDEYEKLKKEFIGHADSILKRRTSSSSHEVSCANGMMNLMRVHLLAMIGHTRFKEQGG